VPLGLESKGARTTVNIAMAEVLAAGPGRNFVTMRITTDALATGIW
jgi:hypothetical protein